MSLIRVSEGDVLHNHEQCVEWNGTVANHSSLGAPRVDAHKTKQPPIFKLRGAGTFPHPFSPLIPLHDLISLLALSRLGSRLHDIALAFRVLS